MRLREQRLQEVLDSLVAAGAAGVLVQYRDADGPWSGASGVAELGTQDPVDPTGSFRIGSVTKTFTATVVLQLIGEGALGLEDKVDRWLPGVVPAGDAITLRQLLNHTTGLYNYTDDLPEAAGIVRDRFLHWEPMRAVSMATGHEPSFEPGARRSYSNTNYILLALIIEAATSKPYATELEDRILSPLDLRQTFLPGDDATLPEPHAHGYMSTDGELVDMTELNTSQAWSAGGIVSTATELNHFYAALLNGELLRPAEFQAMQMTVPTDAAFHTGGLGISRLSLPGLVLWGHSGGIFGYRTWSYHSADATRQVTLSINTTDAAPPQTYDLLVRLFGCQN
ncbi:class A beta-lactamase-related serine hydrolase [Kribbella capetownensis]|uniref:Class A beta-lactamase-related serine hydrolase n=1 Tax=Kribbella capetownensis TaxID=1572659 RepID=A0A4R0JAX9_9ACTN|nr:serine hydrolase domain-containing protein [Kribbella capetownensis]TCC43943.1 class A beta-lactamase-related serine hydrolase [Kribbella capetownensis]